MSFSFPFFLFLPSLVPRPVICVMSILFFSKAKEQAIRLFFLPPCGLKEMTGFGFSFFLFLFL